MNIIRIFRIIIGLLSIESPSFSILSSLITNHTIFSSNQELCNEKRSTFKDQNIF